jgi:dihydrofolate reductase
MSKVVVVEYVSLDGVIQAPGFDGEDRDGGFPHGGWTGPFMADHRRYNDELYRTAGGFLLGRRTYEIFATYWPTVTDPADHIARALNTLPKYVASTTLTEAEWSPATIVRDVPREVARLREEPGDPLFVIGSSGLARSLMEHDLVDSYQLWLHPVVLGSGKRLFAEGSPRADLTLADARVAASGLAILTYDKG